MKDPVVKLLEDSVQALGGRAQLLRLADTADARAYGGKNLPSQPGDHVFFWSRFGGVVEAKGSEDPIGFPLKNVRSSQWSAAKRARIRGGNYAFFVVRSPRSALAEAFVVPGEWLLNFKEQAVRSSVAWELLARFKAKHLTKSIVDLTSLVHLWTSGVLCDRSA